MASGPNSGNSERHFFVLQNHWRWWLQPWNWKMLASWKKSYDEPRQHIKKLRHYFANKGLSSQSYGFSSSHVWIWSWTIKKAERWRIDAFELWCWRRLHMLHLQDLSWHPSLQLAGLGTPLLNSYQLLCFLYHIDSGWLLCAWSAIWALSASLPRQRPLEGGRELSLFC